MHRDVDLQEEWENDRKGLAAMTSFVFFQAAFEMIGTQSPVFALPPWHSSSGSA